MPAPSQQGGGGGGGRRNGKSKKNSGGASAPPSSTPSSILTPSQSQGDGKSSHHLRTKLAHASDLETKLSNLSASSSSNSNSASAEEKASKLRFALCEILSDVLLTDPKFAMRKDCTGRLWRGCFYGRIGELRGRIAREKNRLKRAAAASKGKVSVGKEAQSAAAVEEVERSLQVFLEESIVLYEYLVDKYEGMLLPPSFQTQTQMSQQQSQDSLQSQESRERGNNNGSRKGLTPTSDPEEADYTAPQGVVQNLHRLLIHLGDLHRYASSFSKAESSYSKASKLAPGKGNPYNQIAVVAQLRESASPLTCVALYWYARSLLAVHDPFETSRANVTRLFAGNRVWLETHPEDESQQPPESTAVGAGKKAALERTRAAKSAASRRLLARFVDVHGDFFKGVHPDNLDAGLVDATPEKPKSLLVADDMVDRMSSFLESFRSLLAGAAFGDALLCKMVAINAFSICSGGNEGIVSVKKDDVRKAAVAEFTRGLALAFVLKFGAALADRVERAVSKLTTERQKREGAIVADGAASKSAGGAIPAVRLLSPLSLLCDFVSARITEADGKQLPLATSYADDEDDNAAREFSSKAWEEFWTSVASLANVANSARDLLRLDDDRCRESSTTASLLREYEALAGYGPFRSFIPTTSSDHAVVVSSQRTASSCSSDDEQAAASADLSPTKRKAQPREKEEVYVSPEEAVRALDLLSNQDPSDSGKTSTEGENKVRIRRFLAFVDRMVAHSDGDDNDASVKCLVRDDTGSVRAAGAVVQEEDDDEMAAMEDDDVSHASQPPLVPPVEDSEPDAALPTVAIDGAVDTKMHDNEETQALQDEDDAEEDVIVYKPSESGDGPALLVPGNLLLSKAKQDDAADKARVSPARLTRTRSGGSGGSEPEGMDLSAEPRSPPRPGFWAPGSIGVAIDKAAAPMSPKATTLADKNDGLANDKGDTEAMAAKLESKPAPAVPLPQSQPPKRLGPPPGMSPPPGFSAEASNHNNPASSSPIGAQVGHNGASSSPFRLGDGAAVVSFPHHQELGGGFPLGQPPPGPAPPAVGAPVGVIGAHGGQEIGGDELFGGNTRWSSSAAPSSRTPMAPMAPPGFSKQPIGAGPVSSSSILPPPLPEQQQSDHAVIFPNHGGGGLPAGGIFGGGDAPGLRTSNPFANTANNSLHGAGGGAPLPPLGGGAQQQHSLGFGSQSAGLCSVAPFGGAGQQRRQQQHYSGYPTSAPRGGAPFNGSISTAEMQKQSMNYTSLGVPTQVGGSDWLLGTAPMPSEFDFMTGGESGAGGGAGNHPPSVGGTTGQYNSILRGLGLDGENAPSNDLGGTPSTRNPFLA